MGCGVDFVFDVRGGIPMAGPDGGEMRTAAAGVGRGGRARVFGRCRLPAGPIRVCTVVWAGGTAKERGRWRAASSTTDSTEEALKVLSRRCGVGWGLGAPWRCGGSAG